MTYAGFKRRAGNSFASSKRRKAPYQKRGAMQGKGKFARAVKKVILRTAETKAKNTDYGKTELYHNVTQSSVLNIGAAWPVQGTADNQRLGDEINMTGIKLRFLFGQKGDRPNVNWRLVIGAVPQNYTYVYGSFFKNVTGNSLLDEVNKDRVQVLHQKWFKPMDIITYGQAGGDEYTFTRQVFISRKKLIKFGTDAGTDHNDKTIMMVLVPYDAYGSLLSDNIAYVQTWQSLYYKDP